MNTQPLISIYFDRTYRWPGLVPFCLLLAAFSLLSCFSSGVCLADDNIRPTGQNCDLLDPPSNAGEDSNAGLTMRIYPRARDIGSTYNGCQLSWAQNGDHWIMISAVVIKEGDPERIWSPVGANQERFSCRYKNGQVVSGEARSCASAKSLILKSLAAGCVDKLRKAMAVGGLNAPHPPDCEYQ
jgi:hypothetical protein